MDLCKSLNGFLSYAKEKLLLDELDEIYVRNTAFGILNAGGCNGSGSDADISEYDEPWTLVNAVTDAAVAKGLIPAEAAAKTGKRLL